MSAAVAGTMVFPDGAVYEGEMRGEMMHGIGNFRRGAISYQGGFFNGLFSGDGKLETPDLVYTGQFENGVFSGLGRLDLKEQIYPQLQILSDNKVVFVMANFSDATPCGECLVQTELFEFEGILSSGMYQIGKLRLYGELASVLEPGVDFLDCVSDFRVVPWKLEYDIGETRFSGEVNTLFERCGMGVYNTCLETFRGTFDANFPASGKIIFKTACSRAEIDYEMLEEREFPACRIFAELAAFIKAPDRMILPPHAFSLALDFEATIAEFSGEFEAGKPCIGDFTFVNGVTLHGICRNRDFIGDFQFQNLKFTGTMRDKSCIGDFECDLRHPLHGIMSIKGNYGENGLQDKFFVDSQALSVDACYTDGKLHGVCLCVLKECEATCELVYAQDAISSVCIQFCGYTYTQNDNVETLRKDGQVYLVVRDTYGDIVQLRDSANNVVIKRDCYETPEYVFFGSVFDLEPSGRGVYKNDTMTVVGTFVSGVFEGRCKFDFTFPQDYLKEGMLIHSMTVDLNVYGTVDGHCIIKYENSVFTGQYHAGQKFSGIWQFPAVRFEGEFEKGIFVRGKIYSQDREISGEFVPGDELVYPCVPFALNTLGVVTETESERKITRDGNLIRIETPELLYVGQVDAKLRYNGHGVLNTDRFKYEGEFKEGEFDGPGSWFCYDTQELFEGEFENGKRTGHFRVLHVDDPEFLYDGELVDGQRSGNGVLKTAEFEYDGEFAANEFDGQGKIVYKPDGATYTGAFHSGFKHGKGAFRSALVCYTGDFVYDQFSGDGTLAYFEAGADQIDFGVEKCARLETGRFSENEFTHGTRRAAHFTEEGEFLQGKLCSGTYHGDLAHSVLRVFAHISALCENDEVSIEGDFELFRLGFRRISEASAIYGEVARNQQESYDFNLNKGKIRLKYRATHEFTVDEEYLSEILGENETFRGFIDENLQIGRFGSLETPQAHFHGQFRNHTPATGKLTTREYEFSGSMAIAMRPLQGVLEFSHLTYSVDACFDERLEPLGICSVAFRNGKKFVGMWKHEIFYGSGQIDSVPVRYDILEVPDNPERQWLTTQPINAGKIQYENGSYRGIIVDGLPNGKGRMENACGSKTGNFVDGKMCGVFETDETLDFVQVKHILNNFQAFQLIELPEVRAVGKGEFQNDEKTGKWDYIADGLLFAEDFATGDFMFKNDALLAKQADGELLVRTEVFEFRGSLDFCGELRMGELLYFGKILNSKFQGDGKLETAKLRYKGQFVDSEFQGIGRLENEEFVYAGQFTAGTMHGRGVKKVRASGDVYSGVFCRGRLVQGEVSYGAGGHFSGTFE